MTMKLKLHIFIFCLLSIFIFSCEDKINEEDNSPPSVLITNITDNDVLSEMVEIKIDAIDDNEIKLVQIYVDGVLSNSTSTSSNSIFTINFDTDLYANGNYRIYAKAIDKSDNEANSKILNISIMNYKSLVLNNKTNSEVFVTIDNDVFSTFMIDFNESDTISIPKDTDTPIRVDTPAYWDYGSLNIYLEGVYTLSENSSSNISISDEYFYLGTLNKSGATIDKLFVNGNNFNSDILNNEYAEGYHYNINSNIIMWFDYNGDYLYVDDETNYPVNLSPLNPVLYEDRDLYVYHELPPFIDIIGSLHKNISRSTKLRKLNKNAIEHHLQNKSKKNFVKDENTKLVSLPLQLH